MNIYWELDEEDGIQFDELLGRILIVDTYGRLIKDDYIFLENIFFVLSEALILAAETGPHSVELFDSPGCLTIKRLDDEIEITLRDQHVQTHYATAMRCLLNSYNEFHAYLKSVWVCGKYSELERNIEILTGKGL